jgi:hypothetical protein
MTDTGPPAPISQSTLAIKRVVGSDGKVVTLYVNALTGEEVGLQPQQHHQTQAQGGFVPPAT